MKTSAAAITAASLCFAAVTHAAPGDDCVEENKRGLKEVETLYQGAGLPKPDQDRYKALLAEATKPIKPKGPSSSPGICREKTKKGDRYQQMKVYWQMFDSGQTGWSDASDSGPNRPIFNVRCIRKY